MLYVEIWQGGGWLEGQNVSALCPTARTITENTCFGVELLLERLLVVHIAVIGYQQLK